MRRRLLRPAVIFGAVRRHWPWLLLLLVTVAVHLWDLGGRSFHHDEAVHAKLSFDLAERGDYHYDPTYHGPLLYYLTAASFIVLGDGDFTARLPIALAGIAMLGVAWRLRRPFGDRAAWWMGLLVTISPLFVFYGRFLRMDVLEVVTASAALLAVRDLLRGSDRAWVGLGVWAGLAFATKENAYVTLALVGACAVALALRRGLPAAISATVAWIARRSTGVATALAVFVLVTVPLYTVGFTRPGDWFFPYRAISYWWAQHTIERVGGPWWFHLPRLAQYEFLVLIAAAAWVVRRRRRLRDIELFLLVLGLSSIAMYVYLGEKVPWLGVHQVWPFFPLAGAQLARTFGPRGAWWSRSLAAAGVLVTVGICAAANLGLSEISPADERVESLHFVQTSPELAAVAAEGLALAADEGEVVVAAVSGEAAWPLTWYWRHVPVWWSAPAGGARPPMVICDPGDERDVRAKLGPGYNRERVPLRAWWLMYVGHPDAGEIARYFLSRRPWGSLGSTDVIVLRRTETGTASVREVEVPEALRSRLGVSAMRILAEDWLQEARGVSLVADRVAVADPLISRVAVIGIDGRVSEEVVAMDLKQPEAVAWGGDEQIFIADTWNHRVLCLDTGNGGLTTLPSPDDGWYGPRSLAVGDDGTLVVADTGHKRLVFFDRDLRLTHSLDAAGAAGRFSEPGGVAWIDGDTVLVCDTGNRRLVAVSTAGRLLTEVALPDAWADFYSRPQVAVLGPDKWLVTDTPGASLWLVAGGAASRLDVSGANLVPTGVSWDPARRRLAVGDLGGGVWLMEVTHD